VSGEWSERGRFPLFHLEITIYMELPGNTRIDDDRCFFLLWKGIFIDSWDPDHIPSGDGSFWCNKTQNCIGPDSREVGDYECNETRRCYKAM
jgi:hypothetical protein